MKNNYQLRNSQKDCIEFSKRYFNTTTSKKPEMLWNCKMRFGKCFTAISFAKEMNYSKILIITHMPAVMDEWKETVENHVSFNGWKFYNFKNDEKKITTETFEKYHTVVFCSNQLYYTRSKKHRLIIDDIQWDLVIVDESHIAFDEEGEPSRFVSYAKSYKGKNGRDIITHKLNYKSLLNLTGTPLNALQNGMFSSEQIYSYTYIDERNNKEIDNSVEMKMYLPELPVNLNRPGIGLDSLGESSDNPLSYLNPFYKGKKVLETDDDIISFLKYLEKVYNKGNYNHSIWVLETELSCQLVKQLIYDNYLFEDYAFKIVAGNTETAGGAEIKKDISDFISKNDKTICMTVHKGLTGITIKEWDSVFWLSATASPKKYFQANFRCQNPSEGKNNAVIIDFWKARAIHMIDGYLLTFQNISIGDRVSSFLNYFPVYEQLNGKYSRVDLKKYYEIYYTMKEKEKPASLGDKLIFRHGEQLYTNFIENSEKIFKLLQKTRNSSGIVPVVTNLPSNGTINVRKELNTLQEYSKDVKENFDKIANNPLFIYMKKRYCDLLNSIPVYLKRFNVFNIKSFNDIYDSINFTFLDAFGISLEEFKFLIEINLVKTEEVLKLINLSLNNKEEKEYSYDRRIA